MNIEMKLLFTVSFQKTMVHITLLYYTECYALTELKPYLFLGLKKKLVALSKEKDCEVLEHWIRSITNHLYWVPSATPEGEDEDIRWEKWLSVFRHVQNIHVGHGDHFRQCEHGELDNDDRQKRWLRPGKNRSSFNLDVYKYYILVLFSITFIIIHIYFLVDLVFG